MLYTPVPGTPLYAQVEREGRLRKDVDLADIHGQAGLNYVHAALTSDEAKRQLDRAFRLDYERNGPSMYRLMATMFQGWRRYHDDADPRVRARVESEGRQLRNGYGAMLWAMERFLRSSSREMSDRIRALRLEIEKELGGLSSVIDRVIGPVLSWAARRDAHRFPAGRPLEPHTFVDRMNW
jgi:hypothetical protein